MKKLTLKEFLKLQKILFMFQECKETIAHYEADRGDPKCITRIKLELLIEEIREELNSNK